MLKSTVLTFILFVAIAQALSYNAKPIVEKNLASILLRYGESMGNNPQRNVDCFNTYMPLLTESANRYEKAHNTCLEIAANASAVIEEAVADDRENVISEAQGICNSFTKCSKQQESYALFDCYNDESATVMSTAFEIQTTSKSRMQYIEVKTNMVTYEQTSCTDKCSDEYLQETSKLYSQLEVCLAGKKQNIRTL